MVSTCVRGACVPPPVTTVGGSISCEFAVPVRVPSESRPATQSTPLLAHVEAVSGGVLPLGGESSG